MKLRETIKQAADNGLRFCRRCSTAKSLTEFNRDGGRRDGTQLYCKPCMATLCNAARNKKYEQYRQRELQSAKVRYQKTKHLIDKDAARERSRKWRESHRDLANARTKAWYTTHPGGWACTALAGMRQRSKRRGFPPPEISTIEDLSTWLQTTKFKDLWSEYVASGYDKFKRPSIDRLDNMRPYTRDNIRLVTWRENLDAWNKSDAAKENGRVIGTRKRTALIAAPM